MKEKVAYTNNAHSYNTCIYIYFYFLVTEKQQSEGEEKGGKKPSTLQTVANFSGMGFLFFTTMGGLLQINRLPGQRLRTSTAVAVMIARFIVPAWVLSFFLIQKLSAFNWLLENESDNSNTSNKTLLYKCRSKK